MAIQPKNEKQADKARDTADKAEANRQQPDKPVGVTVPGEDEDFYARQRRESPDGMTPAERDQWQKGAPGSLDQKSPAGEQLGEAEDAGAHPGGTEQSGGL